MFITCIQKLQPLILLLSLQAPLGFPPKIPEFNAGLIGDGWTKTRTRAVSFMQFKSHGRT
jgi:hypothetical protein